MQPIHRRDVSLVRRQPNTHDCIRHERYLSNKRALSRASRDRRCGRMELFSRELFPKRFEFAPTACHQRSYNLDMVSCHMQANHNQADNMPKHRSVPPIGHVRLPVRLVKRGELRMLCPTHRVLNVGLPPRRQQSRHCMEEEALENSKYDGRGRDGLF